LSFSQADLKNAYARWATGVTIVTARAGDRIRGMTVSAFTEVSLEPPLVLVCIGRAAKTQFVIAEGGAFAVNILARTLCVQGRGSTLRISKSKAVNHAPLLTDLSRA
jgi:flavin reductase (DIM6/NTAB) family NADH-FMN oxidoreductase RutF